MAFAHVCPDLIIFDINLWYTWCIWGTYPFVEKYKGRTCSSSSSSWVYHLHTGQIVTQSQLDPSWNSLEPTKDWWNFMWFPDVDPRNWNVTTTFVTTLEQKCSNHIKPEVFWNLSIVSPTWNLWTDPKTTDQPPRFFSLNSSVFLFTEGPTLVLTVFDFENPDIYKS